MGRDETTVRSCLNCQKLRRLFVTLRDSFVTPRLQAPASFVSATFLRLMPPRSQMRFVVDAYLAHVAERSGSSWSSPADSCFSYTCA